MCEINPRPVLTIRVARRSRKWLLESIASGAEISKHSWLPNSVIHQLSSPLPKLPSSNGLRHNGKQKKKKQNIYQKLLFPQLVVVTTRHMLLIGHRRFLFRVRNEFTTRLPSQLASLVRNKTATFQDFGHFDMFTYTFVISLISP
jgi:hypothetical protein